MWKKYHFLLAFFLLFLASFGVAIKVEVGDIIEAGSAEYYLENPIQVNNKTFCFSPKVETPKSLFCSFDAGRTFNTIDFPESFCASTGAAVEGRLICPKQEGGEVKDFQGSFSSISFIPKEASFEQLLEDTPTIVDFSTSDFDASSISFGETIYAENRNEYYRCITLHKEEESRPLLFSSENGFLWKYVSELPFNKSDNILLTYKGNQLSALQKSNDTLDLWYSKDFGKSWLSGPKNNASFLGFPHISSFASGLTVESMYSGSNSSMNLRLSVFTVPFRRELSLRDYHNTFFPSKLIDNSIISSVVGHFPVIEEKDYKELITIYELCSVNHCNFFSARIELNDEEEQKIKEKRAEELERKGKERAKAAEEAKIRRMKLKEEMEKKKKELKKKFDSYNAPFLASAKKYQEKDGEMIIVREKVIKQYLEYEREAFFDE